MGVEAYTEGHQSTSRPALTPRGEQTLTTGGACGTGSRPIMPLFHGGALRRWPWFSAAGYRPVVASKREGSWMEGGDKKNRWFPLHCNCLVSGGS